MMRTLATAKAKLPDDERLLETLEAYGKALQFCVDRAWKFGKRTRRELHHECYYEIKERYGLQAQLAVNAIKQALEMVRRSSRKPQIRNVSIRYNFPRSASVSKDWKELSLATVKGRIKLKIEIPECYGKYLEWDLRESHLTQDRKGKLFFHFTFAKEIHARKELYDSSKSSHHSKVLGVDLGVNKLATTSDNRFYGSDFKAKRAKRDKVVANLQRKGTPSSKRTLKSLSGRWKRFQHWLCHNISKHIIDSLEVGDVIVMEDLNGIREPRNCKYNKWVHKWPFRQLQKFIEYKALHKGIRVVYIDPKNTSKLCSRCGSLKTERHGGFFECGSCGSKLDADMNAARNMARRYMRNLGSGASVGVPEAPRVQSSTLKKEYWGILSCTSVYRVLDRNNFRVESDFSP